MNLELRKFHLIEKIVSLQDETKLIKLEQIFSPSTEVSTPKRGVIPPATEDGIVIKRSIYRISDRPTTVETKTIKATTPNIAQEKPINSLQQLLTDQANNK